MTKVIKTLRKIKNFIDCKFIVMKNKSNGSEFNETNKIRKGVNLCKSKIGKYTDINANTSIAHTVIGNYSNISWDVEICPRSHIYTNFTTHDFVYTNSEHIWECDKPYNGYLVDIGNDVWIGCKVIILPGVKIGDGAVIAAGSVVTKSIPPYAVVGGNPCKFIKWRFSEEVIKKLNETEWYYKEPDEIISIRSKLEELVEFDINKFRNNYLSRRKDII